MPKICTGGIFTLNCFMTWIAGKRWRC